MRPRTLPLRLSSAALMSVITLCAALPAAQAGSPASTATPASSPTTLRSGLDLAGFDRTVRPQDDLYRFAGGTWLAKTEIPADRSNYGTFSKLEDDAQASLRQIAEAVEQHALSMEQIAVAMNDINEATAQHLNVTQDNQQVAQIGRAHV